jgi:hypothetical protein
MTQVACTIELFTDVILVKAVAYQSGALIGLHCNGRLLALPAIFRLGWK